MADDAARLEPETDAVRSVDVGRRAAARAVHDVLASDAASLSATWRREPEGIRFCMALLVAAALDGETVPDLLDEVRAMAAD